ncbi:hypothetical protein C5B42_05820 [Candidatus Cerribacteria bacterium 'Amazon FNV 2010 28 9']|uniref:Solute-binding protein family 5 domain-containing protein n=1 Tax=Candidatus Cerribacteria bacterium 'Amazon FNV 2010 28 9' TaxID=2081795 RepID=A0A317JR11_9BACT|nr:MAG: hypothetical protein C5B42_05820 [Candidatus Cerribacteria bacterium 'Amazon FNV 2010 28 9']
MRGWRRTLWYVQAFYDRHKTVLIVSVIAGVILSLISIRLFAVIPGLKKTIYIGRVGHYSLAAIPRDIQEKVSFGLTQSFENGDVVPALASSFSREENGKAYRFTIRPKVAWQDGKEVTPEDVTYNFADTQVSRSQNDIVFRLTAQKQDPNAQEPVLPVSFTSIVSQPLFRQISYHNILFQPRQEIVGLGKYRIASISNQSGSIDEMTLESNSDELVYRFYATEHDAIIGFKRGEVDTVEGLLGTEDLSAQQNVGVTARTHTDEYIGLFFNMVQLENINNPLANKQLRQALNFALQKPTQNRAISPIDPQSFAYITQANDVENYNQNMTTATNLLMKLETPTKIVLDLQTPPNYTSIADQAKHDWEELGNMTADQCEQTNAAPRDQCENKRIQVNEHITSFPDTQNFQVIVAGQQIPNDPDQYTMWDSTQPTNFTHYKNPRVDKLLEDGRRTTDKEQRKLIYQEFQTTLVQDSPVIFYQYITTYDVARKVKLL